MTPKLPPPQLPAAPAAPPASSMPPTPPARPRRLQDLRFSPVTLARLPLRVIFIITVIGQLLGAVALVGYFSFQNGQKAVNNLATQLRQELIARTERELQGYFAIPHEINRLNADSLIKENLDIRQSQRGESQLYQQMVIAPTVAFVYCGSNQSGEFFGVIRSPQDGSLQLSYSNRATQFRRVFYRLNASGDRTFFVRQTDKPFDARQRPWYKRAIASERAVWTDIYIAFTTGLPNITAALPVYDESERKLLGVCATDVVLPEEFRAFLRNLQVGRNGQVFVLDRAGHLIADSTNDRLMVGAGDNAKLLPATESKAPLVRQTAQYLQTQFGNLRSITASQQREFSLNNQRQYLQVVPFRDKFGLDWLIVVVVPEADFMGQITANTHNTILLCFGTAVLAIGVGVLTSRWITRPILQFAAASDKLAQGDLNQSIAASPIIEIDTLANSFNSMAKQLKTSFDALRIAEENYRSIFENALEGIFQSSPEGHYINANPALARIYGYDSPAEMMASITNIAEQLYVDPENRAEFRDRLEKQEAVKNFEYCCYRKDGSIIWVEIDARVVRANNGTILYYEGIVQDITERKQQEDELKRQLAALKVEIDQSKLETEVALLTESTYFQEIQQEMSEVNLDEFWS